MHYMELGGAESALLGLLQGLDSDRVAVDLFVYDHRGDLFPLIPTDKVMLLPEVEAYSMLERPLVEIVKRGHPLIALLRLIGKIEANLFKESELVTQQKWVTYAMPQIQPKQEYDLAISFVTPHYFVLDKVKARIKIGWIHTDYTKILVNVEREVKMWQRLDHIVSISPEVTKTFLTVFPSLGKKIVEIENIISPDVIHARANEFGAWTEMKGAVRLLSIGRYCEAKNYDNVPDICRRILDAGIDIKWYIIGYGDDSLIRQRIREAGVEDQVILLGKRTNPYPYIKACDIYVQPSRYEGKSITVREAQILCKPVVVTNYDTAPSQIQDGVDGVIVPMDNEGCAQGVTSFILDRDKQEQIASYLMAHDYGNEHEVRKIYELIEKE